MAAPSEDRSATHLDVLQRAREVLARAAESGPSARAGDRDLAWTVELAGLLLEGSRALETPAERRRRRAMARLVADPAAQRFAVALTDRACRRPPPERLGATVAHLQQLLGVPLALAEWQRYGLRLLPALTRIAPELGAAAAEGAVAREASAYVVRGEARLGEVLRASARGDFEVNLNQLGEEVVGEGQAREHLERYLALVQRSDLRTLSVKISALFSQTQVLAFEESLAILRDRLRLIYRAALEARPQKLIYLDMEAYRDVELTLTLFMGLLDEPELLGLTAGAVLQAYLPDSVLWQSRLLDWARQRRARGGAPIRIRLVKGANLAMERVESSLRGWPVPILPNKAEVDAQFRHMLRQGVEAAGEDVAHLGVGSHNLFDIAYALVLRARLPAPERIQLEMLHGMAEPLRRAVTAVAGPVLVYVPAVDQENFPSAVAYLVRRFDENAAEENFLRHAFAMARDDESFAAQRERFERSHAAYVERTPLRVPVRGGEPAERRGTRFANEPDTDPSRPGDREFLRACLCPEAAVERVPLVLGPGEVGEGPAAPGFDPSRPGVVPYSYRLATEGEIEAALTEAAAAAPRWGAVPVEERVRVLRAAARELRQSRGELIHALVLDGGKRIEEADVEVSEAIDFAEYYAASFEELADGWETRPRGVVLVTPPWNFPLAIPLGGVLAALVAGNAVLLKPASETPLVAYLGALALWRAGVPREALQFVPCHERIGSRLVTDPRVDTVILTGATETARLFRRMRPGIRLLAETGGKNAMIVSSLCDRELAIRDAVRSAFGHSGQKCSALSLLILERDLYDSGDFRRVLRDAAASLLVGSAWDPRSFITPLIHPPSGDLARALHLQPGEEWLLEPGFSGDNPRLMSPGIKLGVRATSHAYRAELFGPMLSVLRAEDLTHALQLANGTAYGLTAGFHGLDETEQQAFVEGMHAGNLYLNRTTTGAIVGRQPFGGVKASSFGPGAKAGGPNYVQQLCRVERRRVSSARRGQGAPGALSRGALHGEDSGPLRGPVSDLLDALRLSLSGPVREQLDARLADYRASRRAMARAALLQPELLGEANWFRYRPCRVVVLIGARATALEVGTVLGIHESMPWVELCVVGGPQHAWLERLCHSGRARSVPDVAAAARSWAHRPPDRVRLVGVDVASAWGALGATDTHIEGEPLAELGRVELLRYVVEQSVCISHHRYGNQGMAEFAPTPGGLDTAPRGIS